MKPSFWLDRWNTGQIGFHQSEAEPNLVEFFPRGGGGRVFVPLCGKSLDLVWLARQGFEVVGVELSPLACDSFFSENFSGQEVLKERAGDFTVYRLSALTIYCGDFFKLSAAELGQVRFVYDRAALIALPPELRRLYVEHLVKIVRPEELLLITLEYPQDRMTGPPFSIGAAEVERLYGDAFAVEHSAARDESASFTGDSRLSGAKVYEHVFRLKTMPSVL